MKYDATIKMVVACDNDAAARTAEAELKKFLSSTIVKITLIGRGITLMADPVVTITKKK